MKLVTADLLDFYYNHIGLFRNFKNILYYVIIFQRNAQPRMQSLPMQNYPKQPNCAGPILGSKFVKK